MKKEKESLSYFHQNEELIENNDSNMIKYLRNYAGFPVTSNNEVKYYPLGDDSFESIINELKKAEKFVFFEYFIVNNGIKIYKYTPSFIHSKVFISDDIKATVGTINLDYRSLFFHFECGCYIEKCDVIKDIKKDTEETFIISELVEKKKVGKIKSFWQSILRLFSPLM